MSTKNAPNIFSILAIIFLALAGNLAYFIYYHNNEPSCGLSCVIFFNLSALSLFLPCIAPTVFRSQHLSSSLSLVCGLYFIIETILAAIFITNHNSRQEALVIQLVVFIVFMALIFYINGVNRRTDLALKETRASYSQGLLQAKAVLSQALATVADTQTRSLLRSALADINSSPLTTSPNTAAIEESILSSAEQLASSPSKNLYQTLELLVRQRNTIIRSSNF